MRVNLFSTLAAASCLSLGLVMGCQNPCAGKTTNPNTGAEVETDPCAGKTEANPCAGKTEANPCAGKSE
ncbi:MAG: hypothetical protein D6680_21620 [Cyanobacteria bacterium J007]|nr:MAG: hypothetical protein D6680_21620 [Cyanobacteria bacterium J007]